MYIDQANQVNGLTNSYNYNSCGLTSTSTGEIACSAQGLASLLSSSCSTDSSASGLSQVISQLVELVTGLLEKIFGSSEAQASETSSSQNSTSTSSTDTTSTEDSGFKFSDLVDIGKDIVSIFSGRKSVSGTFKAISSAYNKIKSWF